ncbi:MAG: prolipoprotein diacylglyceryl transferase [Lachnospiraceae bacterium]|nr:prolipoprotein diacylglyceryl transferase [Lachnospiraceae bacterium]
MNPTDISFPHLHLYLHNVPQGINVFGFEIKLYAIAVVLGMFAGGSLAAWIAKREGWSKEIIWDFFYYGVFFGVLGARIYYVIFSWDYYKNDFIQVFNIRQGGLAIYGGVIAAFLTVFIYCRVKKLSGLRLLDTCVPGLILGQAIGRWGNFFNREVFGEYTDNVLAMRLPISAVRTRDISEGLMAHIGEGENFIQVHPTFLYESLWNIGVVVLLVCFGQSKLRRFYGEIALLYMAGYGLGRFWIEGIRTDTLFIPGTTLAVSQVLALVMLVGSIIADVVIRYLMSQGKLKSIDFCPQNPTEN